MPEQHRALLGLVVGVFSVTTPSIRGTPTQPFSTPRPDRFRLVFQRPAFCAHLGHGDNTFAVVAEMASRPKVAYFLVTRLCVTDTEILVKRCQSQCDECKEQLSPRNRFRVMLKTLEIVCLCSCVGPQPPERSKSWHGHF